MKSRLKNLIKRNLRMFQLIYTRYLFDFLNRDTLCETLSPVKKTSPLAERRVLKVSRCVAGLPRTGRIFPQKTPILATFSQEPAD